MTGCWATSDRGIGGKAGGIDAVIGHDRMWPLNSAVCWINGRAGRREKRCGRPGAFAAIRLAEEVPSIFHCWSPGRQADSGPI